MKQAIVGCAISVMFSILGASAVATERETPASLLAGVNTSDGINKSEAEKIAAAYFMRYIGCGSFLGISEVKDAWVVEGLYGRAAEPIKGFLINKRSGAIVSPVGPSYKRPQDLLR